MDCRPDQPPSRTHRRKEIRPTSTQRPPLYHRQPSRLLHLLHSRLSRLNKSLPLRRQTSLPTMATFPRHRLGPQLMLMTHHFNCHLLPGLLHLSETLTSVSQVHQQPIRVLQGPSHHQPCPTHRSPSTNSPSPLSISLPLRHRHLGLDSLLLLKAIHPASLAHPRRTTSIPMPLASQLSLPGQHVHLLLLRKNPKLSPPPRRSQRRATVVAHPPTRYIKPMICP